MGKGDAPQVSRGEDLLNHALVRSVFQEGGGMGARGDAEAKMIEKEQAGNKGIGGFLQNRQRPTKLRRLAPSDCQSKNKGERGAYTSPQKRLHRFPRERHLAGGAAM